MELFVGLDVSMDETSICVVDRDGKIFKECKAATDPAAIHGALKPYAGRLRRVGLEAQAFSPWLAKNLTKMGLPVIVVEAVHMQKALSAQRNKTDRNDARGIAHMMRVGWFREVHVKDDDTQRLRVLLSGAGFSNANWSTSRTSFAGRSRRSESRSARSVAVISRPARWSLSRPPSPFCVT